MGAERRPKIYDLAVKYDFIIVEDDQYYFLQSQSFEISVPSHTRILSNGEFLESLAPSFLRLDYQDRVTRLDSFSNTLVPGFRLGYFEAKTVFTERLLRATEIETQEPSGLSRAIVLALLQKWTLDGYVTWLQNLRRQYQMRRECMINAFAKHFELSPESKSSIFEANGIIVSLAHKDEPVRTPVFSFVPTTSVMFI